VTESVILGVSKGYSKITPHPLCYLMVKLLNVLSRWNDTSKVVCHPPLVHSILCSIAWLASHLWVLAVAAALLVYNYLQR
jgi:hypothetical protein